MGYEKLRRAADVAIRTQAMDYERLRRAADVAIRAQAMDYERLRRAADVAIRTQAMDYERLKHTVVTTAARAAQDRQYLQKQVSLGFPNIIKDGLLTNPSGISTSQRRTPLLDPLPTINTDEVPEEISPEIIPAPSPQLVPITNHKPVFIVHGHDHKTRDEVSKFVSN